MDAIGLLPFERHWFGAECAGTIAATGPDVVDFQIGDEVIALAPGSFSTHVVADARMVQRKPQHLSFAEASTISVAFLTARYALHVLARISAADRVLIHAGAGGVGLAAIQLAQQVGAEIFATAGTAEKRRYLRSLGVPHVMDSRSLDFADQLMSVTGGRGVDIVLNSLAGDSIPKSLAVLTPNGRFLELGKSGTWDDARVVEFRSDISYFLVALNEMTTAVPELIASLLRELIQAFESKALEPLPVQVFTTDHVVDAFRTLEHASHIGKIAVVQRSRDIESTRTYLITGGLSGLGLLVAQWMVDRGARHLVLAARTPPTADTTEVLQKLEREGARILVVRADVSQRADVARVLEDIRASFPPLAGVIHAAGVLDDGALLQLSWPRFADVLGPKVDGAWNLHSLTEHLDLDFFVLFSSIAAVLGSAGQANHAAANAFLDGLAHYRRARHLPALSVNWSAWTDIGAAARRGDDMHKSRRGIVGIAPNDGLNVLDELIRLDQPQVAVLPIDWSQFASQSREALLSDLRPTIVTPRSPKTPFVETPGFVESLKEAPPSERVSRLTAHVQAHVIKLLGLDQSHVVDPRRPLEELGVDSLVAVELRNALSASLSTPLPATLLFDYPTVEVIVQHLIQDVLSLGAPAQAVVAPAISSHTEVAIIGVGCRFPGGAADPQAFWEVLRDGVDGISEIPPSRWDVRAYFDADPDKPGTMNSQYGGFVSSIDQFDAAFFGIAPREAVSMDPQQRLLLEVIWNALEHAGQAPDQLSGTDTGVFVGISTNDYAGLIDQAGLADSYRSTGNAASIAAGRISYALGLQGPSLAVDTACSSSLVAVHLACQSVRSGECRMAVAGGVNLILSPTSTVALSALHMLAPDGRCKTFDAGANGFVRGEGCGVVVLKRLADAVADGDRVLAVIRGTAVNQDGRSSGLTAPNGPAQQAVIRRALAAAGVAPAAVQYVEAHGTGTALGDPIEVQALGAVLGEGRAATDPVVIGSVKSNIGHLEAAAGVAGLIKVVLALAHGEIPAQLHFRAPNPYIAWGTLPVAVAQTRQPWPAGAPLRLAGVSSFGFGGTNAHVVVEEGPRAPSAAVGNARPLSLLTLSAKSAAALHQLTERVHRHLATVDDEAPAFAEVCFTAYVGRAHFAHRLAVVAATASDARAQLEASLQGAAPAGVVRGEAPAAGSSRLARLPIPARDADRAAWGPVLAQWAEAYVCGAALDWPALEAGAVRRKVAFPTYPFQRHRYWIDGPAAVAAARPAHPLLGPRVRSASPDVVFETQLTASDPVLREHRVHDHVVLPGAAQLGMVFAAAAEVWGPGAYAVEAVTFREALVLAAEQPVTVQVIVRPEADGGARFELRRAAEGAGAGGWRVHATGRVRADAAAVGAADPGAPPGASHSVADFYAQLAAAGYALGPRFQWIAGLWHAETTAWAQMRPATGEETAWAGLHPGLLDSCFQVMAATLDGGAPWPVYMPLYVERMRYQGPGVGPLSCEATRTGAAGETVTADLRVRDARGALVAEITGLAVKRASRAALEQTVQRPWRDWLYQVAWRPQPLAIMADRSQDPVQSARGTWVIYADGQGIAAQLADRMRSHGDRAVLLEAGARTERLEADRFQVDPLDRTGMRHVLEAVTGEGPAPWRGVVHLWSLDLPAAEGQTGAEVQAAQGVGCGSVLHLVHALGPHATAAWPPLWLITRGAQSVAGDAAPPAVLQAPLWGLGSVIALEHPEFQCRRIDLDPAGGAAPLWDEICHAGREDQVAFRGDTRLVARLTRAGALAVGPDALEIQKDATYLITGGPGGLGLKVARWLVERGATRLILVSRSMPSPAARQTLEELEQKGARVQVCRADVSRKEEIAAVLQQLDESWLPVRGIIHAAGILDDGVLMHQSWDRFTRVMAPKIAGAWHLHELTADWQLDWFVLFSSATSVLGSPGQGSHAASNAFLDALAFHRRALGKPALSIDWGPWSEVGSAANVTVGEHMFKRGVSAISPERGVQALERALTSDVTRIAILQVDWPRFLEQRRADETPLLDELADEARRQIHREVPTKPATDVLRRMAEASPASQRDILFEHVQHVALATLGINGSEDVDLTQPLSDLGLDSLMALDLTKSLSDTLRCTLPSTLLFSYPTVTAISEHLARDVLRLESMDEAAAAFQDGDRDRAALWQEVDRLSENEAHVSLLTELENIGY